MSRRSWCLRAALAASLITPLVLQGYAPTSSLAAKSRKQTTLRRTIVGKGNRNLDYGPGSPRVTRSLEWGSKKAAGRPLAGFKQVSDIHVIDEESPARVEFLDGCGTPFSAAYRVNEAMSAQIGHSMLKRLAKIKRGPATGVPLDFVVSTGDNADNNQVNETRWFIKLLNGAKLTPNSGGPDYDGYTKEQFSGALPLRTLRRAQKGFDSAGAQLPWYAVLGNHDGLVQGNAPRNDAFESVAVGNTKVFSDIEAEQDCPEDQDDFQKMQDVLQNALLGSDARPVPADPARRFLTRQQLVKMYLNSGGRPAGHGLARAPYDGQSDSRGGYYSFPIGRKVRGIVLDTISYEGVANGHIPDPQFDWLLRELRKWSPYRWVDGKRKATRFRRRKLIVIFSHHSSVSLNNPGVDESGEPYHCFRRTDTPDCQAGRGLKSVLHSYPNVIAWVNGHEHNNVVRAYPYPGKRYPERGFWELNTAAHIDWPQQSRVIEIAWSPKPAGKADTVMIYGTTVDHGGPLDPDEERQSRLKYLASIARVEAFVDACRREGQAKCEAAGRPKDRNVKLIMKAPYNLGKG